MNERNLMFTMRSNLSLSYFIFYVFLISWSLTSLAESNGKPSDKPPNGESTLWERARAVNNFGFKLTTTMMKQEVGSNIVMSPTAVVGLLAMTLLGSVGSTYDELAEALGFSQDILINRQNHQQLGDLLKSLTIENTASSTLYADAVMVDAHAYIRDAYRDYLKRVYNGEALSIRFNDNIEAMESINRWVKNHTNNKIEDFLQQPLPFSTQVVLLSALYFSGQWERPFFPEYTRKLPFITSSSKEVIADLMLHMGKFNYTYSTSTDLHMIALPYNDNTTVMYVLKPFFPKSTSLSDLLDRLDYEKIDALISQMRELDCTIRFPKMEITSKTSLDKSLKALGVNTLFSPTEANLALMIDTKPANRSEEELITRINSGDVKETKDLRDKLKSLQNPGIYIDTVLHDVKMTINEYGTEAAAAAAGFFSRTAQQFYVNSPFYMFIRNEKTKLVTFSAVIFDPTV